MFYEERCIDGAWEHRTTPRGEWKPGRLEAEQTKVVPRGLYWLSFREQDGSWTDWREVTKAEHDRALGKPDYRCHFDPDATPAPVQGSGGEAVYQARTRYDRNEGNWRDCTREHYEKVIAGEMIHAQDAHPHDARILYTHPVPPTPSPGSEGAAPIHNAADSTDDSAGHVKGAGEQAGEVVGQNPWRYERALARMVKLGQVSQQQVDDVLALVDAAWVAAGVVLEAAEQSSELVVAHLNSSGFTYGYRDVALSPQHREGGRTEPLVRQADYDVLASALAQARAECDQRAFAMSNAVTGMAVLEVRAESAEARAAAAVGVLRVVDSVLRAACYVEVKDDASGPRIVISQSGTEYLCGQVAMLTHGDAMNLRTRIDTLLASGGEGGR